MARPKSGLAEAYGYLLLAEQGKVVYNPSYVVKYGAYMIRLSNLRSKGVKPTDPLYKAYLKDANSARFFATYPADLSQKTYKERYNIHWSANLRPRRSKKTDGDCE